MASKPKVQSQKEKENYVMVYMLRMSQSHRRLCDTYSNSTNK